MARRPANKRRVDEQFGTSLKTLRNARGWTAKQLAEALGVSDDTIRKWERGDRSPDLHLLLRIRALFNCTLDRLITGSDEPPQLIPFKRFDDL